MLLFFVKVGSQLIYPLGLFLILWLVSLLQFMRGKTRFAITLFLFSGAAISFAATPKVAALLAGSLEHQYPAQSIESLPNAEVAVVLGGLLAAPHGPRQEIELTGTSDRLHHAYRLWKAGKVNQIFITGGNVFDGFLTQSESEYAKTLLIEWGVDPSAIEIGTKSKTTEENASEAATFLKQSGVQAGKIFLVTSALHMPRSVALFRAENLDNDERQGIELIPVSTDIEITPPTRPAIFSWIPSAAALALTTRAWHEKVGLWYYQFRP